MFGKMGCVVVGVVVGVLVEGQVEMWLEVDSLQNQQNW
jgi:hypothetical protein